MELDEIRHLLDQFVFYNQTITNRIVEAKQKAEESRHHIDQLKDRLATLVQKRARLYQEFQAANQHMELNKKKIASLRKEIVAAETEGGLQENRLREFETRAKEMVQDMTDIGSRINTWKERALKYDSDQPEHKELEGLLQSVRRLERRKEALKKKLEGGSRGTARGQKLGQTDTGAKTILELEQEKLRLQLKKEDVLRQRKTKTSSHEDLHRQLEALRMDQLIYEERNRQVLNQLKRQASQLRFRRNCLLQERGALGPDDVTATVGKGRENGGRLDDHGAAVTAFEGVGQLC